MNTKIYTRKTMGLDNRVWQVMLALIILPLGLLSYRLIDKKECVPVDFTIKALTESKGNIYNAGETIIFKTSAKADNITWDFGDGTEKVYGPYVLHKFQAEGDFFVTASTGSGCENIKQVTIKKTVQAQKVTTNADYVSGDEIVGSLTTMAGKEELFTCMVTAGSYEWSIPNYPKMIQTGPTAKFIFPRPGKYLVQVTLDHDRTKRYSKEVVVEEAPQVEVIKPKYESPEVLVPLIPKNNKPVQENPNTEPVVNNEPKIDAPNNKKILIADATFMSYLEKVQKKEMGVNDFDQYLCAGAATKVVVNGDIKDLTTLAAFCQKISGSKKINLTSVSLLRNDGCVTLIQVKYKKSKVLGIF